MRSARLSPVYSVWRADSLGGHASEGTQPQPFDTYGSSVRVGLSLPRYGRQPPGDRVEIGSESFMILRKAASPTESYKNRILGPMFSKASKLLKRTSVVGTQPQDSR